MLTIILLKTLKNLTIKTMHVNLFLLFNSILDRHILLVQPLPVVDVNEEPLKGGHVVEQRRLRVSMV